MKRKPKSGEFTDEVYGVNFYVLWDINDEQLAAFCAKAFDSKIDLSSPWFARCLSFHREDSSQAIVLAFKEWDNTATHLGALAHECLHATHNVLEDRMTPLNQFTKEPYCYLLESIIRRTMKILQK